MKNLNRLLKNEIIDLGKAGMVLEYSYQKCRNVHVSPDLTNEELESYEALASRFARLSDIIIQKVFRSIEALDL